MSEPDGPHDADPQAADPQTDRPDPAPSPGAYDTEQEEAYNLRNINNFYGQVVVEGVVGIAAGSASGSGSGPRRGSGKLTPAETARVARCYLRTDTYHRAAAALRTEPLVVLVGAEDTGRAAAAVMLAEQFRGPGGEVFLLPPTRTLEDLARTAFQAGAVYLVQDWSPVAGDGAAAARFDAGQLTGRLRATGARLVITATRGGEEVGHILAYTVPWAPVDPKRLLAYCLDHVAHPGLSAADRDRLAERAAQLGRPARVVELAEGLVDGVEVALAAVADADAERVVAWFDGRRPPRRVLAAATTLAFFSGTGLRRFEQLADDLDRRMAVAARAAPGVDLPEDAPFPQTRVGLITESGLGEFLTEQAVDRAFDAEHRLRFRTGHHQELFMAELARRYGPELWSPVREWLGEAVERPLEAEHFAVARGLAALCRHSPSEVARGYLDTWAAGRTPPRLAAAATLSAMAGDDRLAPLALSTAVSWVRNRGQQRAMAAAVALGGELGQRYLTEALHWLWILSLRGGRIRPYARRALGHLLAAQTDADAGSVPRFLAGRVRRVLKPGADPEDRRLVLDTVVAVLAEVAPGSGDPVVAVVLRTRPRDVPVLAELWATALRSAWHRRDAVSVLQRTLQTFARGEATADAARLGAALLPLLPPEIRDAVGRGLTRPGRHTGTSPCVLQAFLDSTARPARPAVGRRLR